MHWVKWAADLEQVERQIGDLASALVAPQFQHHAVVCSVHERAMRT